MTIWKFELKLNVFQEIEMPNHADIRHVGLQNDTICLWAEVRPENQKVMRKFYVVGTGHPIPTQARLYVGSVQQPPFVWHIYQ